MKALKPAIPSLGLTLSQRLGLVGILGLVLFLALGVTLTRARRDDDRQHRTTLNQLSNEIKQIDESLGVPEPGQMAQDLSDYLAKLKQVEQLCQTLDGLRSARQQTKQRTKLICRDLSEVVRYSHKLYSGLRPYILLDDSPWPASGTPEYSRRLEATLDTIEQTKLNITSIDNSEMKDPALEELLTQVEDAKSGLDRLARSRAEAIPELSEQLRLQLLKDKTDFLAARTYFWKNTVGVAKLREGLAKIEFLQ